MKIIIHEDNITWCYSFLETYGTGMDNMCPELVEEYSKGL